MSTNDFPAPVSQRFFEDYVPGLTSHSEVAVISETAILQFAREFDPQPIHTDEAAASAGVFGGLIASGWHSAAITMRLMLGCYLNANASLASPGVDELRWLQPVRPGDELTATFTVLEARPSTSKSDRGIVRSSAELRNGPGEVVLTLLAVNILRRRSI